MSKNFANRVLVFVFMLFLLAVCLKYFYPGQLVANMFYATMTAALIGGIADWFAVTAIFKKPLGFPWHTALIPRHRDRVIVAVADMIERELLTVDSIKQRLDKVNFVKLFIEWTYSESGRRFLRLLLLRHSQTLIDTTKPDVVAKHFEAILKQGVHQVKLTPHVKSLIDWLLISGKGNEFFDNIIYELIYTLETPDTRKAIRKYLERIKEEKATSIVEKAILWFGERTDSVNLGEAADVLHAELLLLLNDLKNPEHRIRQWMNEKLRDLAMQLGPDSSLEQAIEKWKNTVLENVEIKRFVTGFAKSVLEGTSLRSDSPILLWLNKYIERYWCIFKENTALQDWLEEKIKGAVYKLIESEHYIIGQAVQQVLEKFTNEALSQFVEDKAGDDLQWIRVNGSVVGGLVGFMLFMFLHFIYDPYVLGTVKTILN